jgi:hypothetical protein
MKLADLKGKHAGKPFYIVGKGPSLEHLRKEYFEDGVIITLNNSIRVVQDLDLVKFIYSMQKDGCGIKNMHCTCPIQAPNYSDMVKPKHNIPVILEATISANCLNGYPNVLIIDMGKDFGFGNVSEPSIRVAIKLALFMGASRLYLVCCDSLTNGSLSTYNFGEPLADGIEAFYSHAIGTTKEDLKNLPHSFITPVAEEVVNVA